MIDLDKFCKEVRVFSATGHMIGISSGEFNELITRLRQAEKDSARWNYVINNHCIGNMNMGLYADYNYGMDIVTKDDAIAIIDEAMQCNK